MHFILSSKSALATLLGVISFTSICSAQLQGYSEKPVQVKSGAESWAGGKANNAIPASALAEAPAIGLANANASNAYLAIAIELELSVDAEFSPLLFASQTTRLLFLQTNLRPVENSSALLATTLPPVPYQQPSAPAPGKTSTVVVLVFQQPKPLELPQKYLSLFEKLRKGDGKNPSKDEARRTEFDLDCFIRDAKLVQAAGASLFTVVVVLPGNGGAGATATVTRGAAQGTALPLIGGGGAGNGGGMGAGQPDRSTTTPCGASSSPGSSFTSSSSAPNATDISGLPVGSGGASAVLGGASTTGSLRPLPSSPFKGNSSTSEAAEAATSTSSDSSSTTASPGQASMTPQIVTGQLTAGKLTTLTIWPINYATGGAVVGAANPTGGLGNEPSARPSPTQPQEPVAAGARRIGGGGVGVGLILGIVSMVFVWL